MSSSRLPPIFCAEHAKAESNSKRKTQNSKLTSPFPGALYVRASCLADFSGHVAFRFCMLRLKPREVANEIVKYQDLSVAFGTGTYADCGYRDSASEFSGYGRVD